MFDLRRIAARAFTALARAAAGCGGNDDTNDDPGGPSDSVVEEGASPAQNENSTPAPDEGEAQDGNQEEGE